ncbi:thiol peroxidase Prx-SUH [Aliarcobacter cibarius]|jgi:thioredoxin-dependent peroxiredoxin|uniref:Thiol peroxidase n=1 Tax=Aliarcobacter cibarius TaxID=255507 RepID=A0ABY2V4H4_9BACT|nr:thiol peroxidase [Aliarcobacter cibarius]QEZ88811.1 lipid hydroperoxide peroxidase [Aliarcobacter cibarius]TLS99547.1 thiol peroxidase [Aliarcobacter cibarius]TLS99983.1 thiol peroxidase [Aliarcobacter cibarius]TLT03466.1 thiol peroxidase [Aliarcobacter cibarius]
MATVKFKGELEVSLNGTELNVGDIAPVVSGVAADLSDIQIGGQKGKAQIILAVPSLDTGVCAAEARKFNEAASKLDNAEVIVVSMDLPFAMKRFCTTEGIENLKVASDFRAKAFAKSYGVLQANGPLAGLTARAVFIVNPSGKITYKEIVPEITNEPNYDAVLAAASEATSTSCCGSCH